MNEQACELNASEIAALPTHHTWYGLVGTHEEYLAPSHLTDNVEIAKARALINNTEHPSLGPWRVVALTENTRTLP